MSDTRGNIYPAADLQAWLDAHWSDPATLDRVHLRLPVYVTLTSNKMYVASAKVGAQADALEIKIDDRTLSLPIAGKLSYYFGEGADRGMLWLQGLWRGGDEKTFQVTKIEGAIADADQAAATTAEVLK